MKKYLLTLFLTLLAATVLAQTDGYDPGNPADPGTVFTLTVKTNLVEPDGRVVNQPGLNVVYVKYKTGEEQLGTSNTGICTLQVPAGVTLNIHSDQEVPSASLVGILDDEGRTLKAQEQSTYHRYAEYVMPQRDAVVNINFTHDRVPGIPYANHMEEGVLYMGNFAPGKLASAITTAAKTYGNNADRLVVSGIMTSADYKIFTSSNSSLRVVSQADFSRTNGGGVIASQSFYNQLVLNSVILPACVTEIEKTAFHACSALGSITCFAAAPPKIDEKSFYSCKALTTILVPAESVPLYKEADVWKDYDIQPISEDAYTIELTLPDECIDGRCKGLHLELTNLKNGYKLDYLLTDRLKYLFHNLPGGTDYALRLYDSKGRPEVVCASIPAIHVEDEDVRVAFDKVRYKKHVGLYIYDADGQMLPRVEDGLYTRLFGLALDWEYDGIKKKNLVSIDWYEGATLKLKLTPTEYIASYNKVPEEVLYVIPENETSDFVVRLEPLKSYTLAGYVKDAATGRPVAGAMVSFIQQMGKNMNRRISCLTDQDGHYSLEANMHKTVECTVTADGYQALTLKGDYSGTTEGATLTLDDVLMYYAPNTEAHVNYEFMEAGIDGPVKVPLYKPENLLIEVRNLTTGKDIKDCQHTLSGFVIRDAVGVGDKLEVTFKSSTDAFDPVVVKGEVAAGNKLDLTVGIVQHGGISAKVSSTENEAIVALLFKASGELVDKYALGAATLSISELPAGTYDLVTMGKDDRYNSFNTLSQLTEAGLVAGKDYAKNTVKVGNGKLSEVNIPLVPLFKGMEANYLTSESYFNTLAKASAGSYLTLYANTAFADAYKDGTANLVLEITVPEGMQYVAGSAMTAPVGATSGSIIRGAHFDGKVLRVPLADPSTMITPLTRLCVIPTKAGTYTLSARVCFDHMGRSVVQPLGEARIEVQGMDLTIDVDDEIKKTTFDVRGTLGSAFIQDGSVKVYDDGELIGVANIKMGGMWTAECELKNPYNLSKHNIYAQLTVDGAYTAQSEVKEVLYNVDNDNMLSMVHMYHYNPELLRFYDIAFDYQTKAKPDMYTAYIFNYDYQFTIDFQDNDTTKIKNVQLFARDISKGEWIEVETRWSDARRCWVASLYGAHAAIDNVAVEYAYEGKRRLDAHEMDDYLSEMMDDATKMSMAMSELQKMVEANPDMTSEELLDLLKRYGIYTEGSSDEPEIELPDYDSMSTEELVRQIDITLAEVDALLERMEGDTDSQLSFGDIANMMSPDAATTEGEDVIVTKGTCEGLTPEKLLEEGYNEVECTDGSYVYILQSENFESFVWLERDLRIDTQYKGGASARALARANDKPDDEEYKKQHQKLLEDLQSTLAMLGDPKASISETAGRIVDLFKAVAQLAEDKINMGIEWVSKTLVNTLNKSFDDQVELESKKASLQAEADALAAKKDWQAFCDKDLKLREMDVKMARLDKVIKAKRVVAKTMNVIIEEVLPLLEKMAKSACAEVLSYVMDVYDMCGKVLDVYNTQQKLPEFCKDNQKKRDELYNQAFALYFAIVGTTVVDKAADILLETTKVSSIIAAAPSGGTTLIPAILSFLAKGGKDLIMWGVGWLEDMAIDKYKDKVKDLKCGTWDPNDPNNPYNPKNQHPGGGARVVLDPSGYVYEAVTSNRIEGATATIYYREKAEDDKSWNEVLWDAEEYAQQNPLFTDADGKYRWDVPVGDWQVRINKDGYDETRSEWLPVPPPQLDVNLALISREQPEVTEAHAFEDGVEMNFSKFMSPTNSGGENIYIVAKKDGENVIINDLSFEPIDADRVSELDATSYASKWHFKTATDLSLMDEAVVTVRPRLTSYCNVPMNGVFTQALDIERRVQSITADSVYHIPLASSRQQSGWLPCLPMP